MSESHRDEIAKLEALFSANPDGRVFTHLAEAYRKAGELTRARETLERGLMRHGDYSSAHVVLGRVLLDLRDKQGAEASFRRVLELDRENRVALRALGDLARESGRSREALGFYRTFLLLDPSDEAVAELARSLEALVPPEAAPPSPGAGRDVMLLATLDDELGGPITVEAPAPLLPEPDVGSVGGLIDFGLVSTELPASGLDLEAKLDFGPSGATLDGPDEPADVPDLLLGAMEPEADPLTPGLQAGELPALAADDDARLPGLEIFAGGLAAEAEDEAPEGFALEEMAHGAEGDDETAFAPVVTETMAELYARQGLYAEAADVYRELLRARPDDERLHSRLREMEALADEPAEAPGFEAAIEFPELLSASLESDELPTLPPEEDGAWLPENLGEANVGGDPEEAPEPLPLLEPAPAREAARAGPEPTIGEFLRRLLAFRVAETPTAAAASPTPEPADEDEFDRLFGGGLFAAGTAEPPPPAEDPPALPTPAAGAGTAGGGADDDDLEMFREWLQNLKR